MQVLLSLRQGRALLLALMIVFILLGMAGILLLTHSLYYVHYQAFYYSTLSRYAALSVIEIAVAVLNTYGACTEVHGNLDAVPPFMYKAAGGELEYLPMKWASADYSAVGGTTLALAKPPQRKSAKSRPARVCKVLLMPSSEGYLAHAYGMCAYQQTVVEGLIGKNNPILYPSIWGTKQCRMDGALEVGSYDSGHGYMPDKPGNQVEVGSNEEILSGKDVVVKGKFILCPHGKYAAVAAPHDVTICRRPPLDPEPVTRSWLHEPGRPLSVQRHQEQLLDVPLVHYDNIELHGKLVLTQKTQIYCRGDVTATPESTLELKSDAALVVYVGGNFTFQGSLVVDRPQPCRLQIKGISDDRAIEPLQTPEKCVGGWSVKIEPQTLFAGVIYAPCSNVYVKLSHPFLGAIIGYRLQLMGSSDREKPARIGFDVSLWTGDVFCEYKYFVKSVQFLRE